MVGRTAREQLRLRKQALILQSEVNRRLLESEWQQLQAATSWMGEARRLGQKARSWWPLLASVAGFLAVRGFKKSSPFLGRTGSVLSLITTALSLWKQTRAKTGEQESEAS
jgi:hypothetical protein